MGSEGVLLVRLHKRQPDGSVLGETERTCHLVPLPNPTTVPDSLVAHCGLRIAPEAGEVLPALTGMPCETCMARSPLPVFGAFSAFIDDLETSKSINTAVISNRGEWPWKGG
jgi:hypothetical protein